MNDLRANVQKGKKMILRRSFLVGCAASAFDCITLTSQSNARPVRGGYPNGGKGAQVGVALDGCIFKNFISTASINIGTSGNYAIPSVLNADQYPTGTISANISAGVLLPSNLSTSETYVFAWSGRATNRGSSALTLQMGAPGLTVRAGASFVVGSSGFNLLCAGTNGYIEFQFNAIVKSVTLEFNTGATYSRLSGIILCRKSDYASIISATDPGHLFNTDFVNGLKLLNPTTIRMLGFHDVNEGNNQTLHKYRLNWRTALGFGTSNWLPSCWVGVASGTNSYTCGAAPDTPAQYTEGEVVQLQFVNGSNATGQTINVNGRGVVPIFNMAGNALSLGDISSYMLATLIYDELLGGYLLQAGGLGGPAANLPVELQVGLCNAVGCNLWYQFPPHINFRATSLEATPSVTQIASLIASTLNKGCYFEYANEVWNFAGGFPQSNWAIAAGAALGFPSDNNRQFNGYYGYRLAVMWPMVRSAWGAKAGLKCVNAFQAFGIPGSTDSYRLKGADLASVAIGGQGNATWVSYTGNANFAAFPNRPVDVCDVLSYATYYSGAQCTNFDVSYSNSGGTGLTTGGPSGWSTGLIGAADAYAAGGSTNITNALAFLNWDISQGTNNGTAGGQTSAALKNLIYPQWETIAAEYDGARRSGMANLEISTYEGAMESNWIQFISTAYALGLTESAAVTFNIGSSPAINWTAHDLDNGACVAFTTTGSLPSGLSTYNITAGKGANGGTQFYVVNSTANSFDVSLTPGGAAVSLSGTNSGRATAYGSNYAGGGDRIANLLRAFKNSSSFYSMVQQQLSDFLAAGSASKRVQCPCWFIFCEGPSGNQWSMYPGDVYTAPYQSDAAFQAFVN